MEWRCDSELRIFSSFPYRVEKIRNYYKLFKHVKSGEKSWTMIPVDKFESPRDAMMAAEKDKTQNTLGGQK